MLGITATNQQLSVAHDYQFEITRQPTDATHKIKPDSGPIGVAVNGVPLFEPTTQGPVERAPVYVPTFWPQVSWRNVVDMQVVAMITTTTTTLHRCASFNSWGK
jgi:hypothetical protein